MRERGDLMAKKLAGEEALKALKEALEEKISSGVYDDAPLKAEVQANTQAIATLNGDKESPGSVAYTAAQAVAEIVAAAPESFDTLKEIADWISSHAESASAMNTAISENRQGLEALTELVGDTAVADQIAAALDGLDLEGTYATASALSALAERVSALEEAGYLTLGALSVQVEGSGNAVTGVAYHGDTGVFTVSMGEVLTADDIQEITAEEVQAYFSAEG